MNGERYQAEPNYEGELTNNTERLIGDLFPEDKEFLSDLDTEDTVAALYGMILEIGEDPDEILAKYGITELGGA